MPRVSIRYAIVGLCLATLGCAYPPEVSPPPFKPVTTILELKRRNAYAYALPELEETLARTMRRLAEPPQASFRLFITLGLCDDTRFARFARHVLEF